MKHEGTWYLVLETANGSFVFFCWLEFWVGKCVVLSVLWRRYFCIQMFHKMTFCVWGIGHIREEHMKQIGGVFESGLMRG